MEINFSPWVAVLIFSTLNEAIIEYLYGSVKFLKPYLPLLTLATALFLTFAYQVNLFNLFLGVESANPFIDFLFSGFIISRISNFINDLAQRILKSK